MDQTLLQFMQHYATATGAEIKTVLDEKGFAILTDVDAKIAALTGQDAAILSFLDKIKRLMDAVPGTPEFDEGTNLFTTITSKFDAAMAAAADAKTVAAGVANAVTQVIADLSALAARVLNLEQESAAARRDINALRTDVDGLSGQLTAAFYGFGSIFSNFSSALRGTNPGA